MFGEELQVSSLSVVCLAPSPRVVGQWAVSLPVNLLRYLAKCRPLSFN